MNIIKTTDPKDAAEFVGASVLDKLKSGKKVLLFLTGGSSISVGVKIAEIFRGHLEQNLFKNLTVTLTDERYGEVGHKDSNWRELLEKGFSLPQAKLIPVLTGDDRDTTIKKFGAVLHEELIISEYILGLFGVGADGHTAGILPESLAVKSEDLVFGYDAPAFSRITITQKVVEKLDEAVIWAQGKDKWKVIEDLKEKNTDIIKQPAQILKKIPLLTIFSDFLKE